MDFVYFSEEGKNPREVIMEMIPDENIFVLDLCCGTLSNSILIAKEKVTLLQLDNVDLQCAYATKTGLPDKTVDCIILGLVLHESSPDLIKGILQEAHRVLKDSGNLIVLEWEKQKKFRQIVKFAPLYWTEQLSSNTFKRFYNADKVAFFKKYEFSVEREEHCNYTVVFKLKKQ